MMTTMQSFLPELKSIRGTSCLLIRIFRGGYFSDCFGRPRFLDLQGFSSGTRTCVISRHVNKERTLNIPDRLLEARKAGKITRGGGGG